MDEAVDWFVRMQSDDVGDDDFAAHADWLASDPEHRAAYDRLVEDWTGLDVAADFARRRLAELETAEHPSPVRRLVPRPRIAALAAAAAAVLAVGAVLWTSRAEPQTFATRIGEQRSVELADRSTVHLNTGSEIAVRMTRGTRLVDLRAGEALFEVARDPRRPFVVDVGAGRITVLGTSFDIYRAPESTTVTVLEGEVAVFPLEASGPPKKAAGVVLTHGQQVAITGRGKLTNVRPADLAGVTAWRQGRLHFDGVPLRDVAAEIGRYFEERIVVSDDVAGLQVIANIKIRDLDQTLGFLEEILPIKVARISEDVVRLEPAEGRN